MLLSTYLFLRNRLYFENSLFTLPRQPIQLRESDKSLITVENYSINISVNIAKSEQSSHTPGVAIRGHTTNLLEGKKNGQIKTVKQYVADSFIHSTTCHI